MASKQFPIIPLLINGLSLGIPALVEAVEKGKAKRKARKLAEELSAQQLEVIDVQAAQKGLNAAKGIGSAFAAIGGSVATTDLTGAGASLMSSLTSVPLEALPAFAPEWVQIAYFSLTVAGIVLRFIAQLQAKKTTPAGTL